VKISVLDFIRFLRQYDEYAATTASQRGYRLSPASPKVMAGNKQNA